LTSFLMLICRCWERPWSEAWCWSCHSGMIYFYNCDIQLVLWCCFVDDGRGSEARRGAGHVTLGWPWCEHALAWQVHYKQKSEDLLSLVKRNLYAVNFYSLTKNFEALINQTVNYSMLLKIKFWRLIDLKRSQQD
jgi:hypothetical protein